MRRRLGGWLVFPLVVAAVDVIGAQNLATSPCPAGSSTLGIPDAAKATQDACTQAHDLFQFMAPQLGISLAGGNAVLGAGSTLGGPGHFTAGLRVNAIAGLVPDVQDFPQNTNGAARSTLGTSRTIIGLPTADLALGVYGGFPLPLAKIGGVDLLLSGQYVPKIEQDAVSITPSSSLKIGYGARVGLLDGSLMLPDVSVSYLKRDLPKTDIIGTAGTTTLSVTDATVETSAWRVVASKGLLMFGVAAGYGGETYNQSATVSAKSGSASSSSNTVAQKLSRSNMFLDLSITPLPLFKIVGEVGQTSGGTVETYNTFEGGPADRTLTYFSVGARFKW